MSDLYHPEETFPIGRLRKGGWTQTFTGRQFWPMDARPEDICIEDIAHALSMMCRYGGHCQKFYSVAEHSVLVARAVEAVDEDYALEALLHDASEAYLVDVPRPVKHSLANYAAIEADLEFQIAKRFDLIWPMPTVVKWADNSILADEKAQIMGPEPADWKLPLPPLGVKIECYAPEVAEQLFLIEFDRLVKARPVQQEAE